MRATFAFFLLFCALFGAMQATGSTCNCPDPRINHVSAGSFGMTLLSLSFSSRYLNVSAAAQGLIIKDASAPIRFADNDYYWDDEYYKANGGEHSGVCIYRISYYNKELRKLRYVNGERPANITFGCRWYQDCCDLGCCQSGALNTCIYIMLYTGIGLMLIVFCAQLPGESEEERRVRRARRSEAAGVFFPCQRGAAPEPTDEHALHEIRSQDAPPKYDDLYPEAAAAPGAAPATAPVAEQPQPEQQPAQMEPEPDQQPEPENEPEDEPEDQEETTEQT